VLRTLAAVISGVYNRGKGEGYTCRGVKVRGEGMKENVKEGKG